MWEEVQMNIGDNLVLIQKHAILFMGLFSTGASNRWLGRVPEVKSREQPPPRFFEWDTHTNVLLGVASDAFQGAWVVPANRRGHAYCQELVYTVLCVVPASYLLITDRR
jgi:hypothetical protein